MSILTNALEKVINLEGQPTLFKIIVPLSLIIPPLFTFMWLTRDSLQLGLQEMYFDIKSPQNLYVADELDSQNLKFNTEIENEYFDTFSDHYFDHGNKSSKWKTFQTPVSFYASLINRSTGSSIFLHVIKVEVSRVEDRDFPWGKLTVESKLEVQEFKERNRYMFFVNSGIGPALDFKAKVSYHPEIPSTILTREEIKKRYTVRVPLPEQFLEIKNDTGKLEKVFYQLLGTEENKIDGLEYKDCVEEAKRKSQNGYGIKYESNANVYRTISNRDDLQEYTKVYSINKIDASYKYQDLHSKQSEGRYSFDLSAAFEVFDPATLKSENPGISDEVNCEFTKVQNGKDIDRSIPDDVVVTSGQRLVQDGIAPVLDKFTGVSELSGKDQVPPVRKNFDFDLQSLSEGESYQKAIYPGEYLSGKGYLIVDTNLNNPSNGLYRIKIFVNDQVYKDFTIDILSPPSDRWSLDDRKYFAD